MKNKIFKSIFSVWGFINVTAISVIINLPDCISGTNHINPMVIIATTIYMLYLFTYALFNRRNKGLMLWCIVTVITSVIGIPVAEHHLWIGGWIIPFMLICITPFYALIHLVLGNYIFFYLIIISFSVLNFLINLVMVNTDNKEIKKAKIFNYTVASVFLAAIMCVCLMYGGFKISRSFTYVKWVGNPEGRHKIVNDMLSKHKIIGMTEKEITSLLGNETPNSPETFKYPKGEFPDSQTLTYRLGGYIDEEYLVITIENGRASGYVLAVK